MITPAPASSDLRTSIALTDVLVGLLEFHDPYFRGGTSLTMQVAVSIARVLDLDDAAIDNLSLAALLRDLGRLAKRGQLIPQPKASPAPDERRAIERHVDVGLDLLEGIDLPEAVRTAIRHHHERWDGDGYPDGLREDEIPLSARIIAVADSFSAMVRPRPYRPPLRLPEATEELQRGAGHQYDESVVNALFRVLASGDRKIFGFGLGQHVLVVHSDELRATVLTSWLCQYGFLAESTPDLAKAAERIRRIPIAAVLLAGGMPELAVVDFIRGLRGQPGRPNLPVMVIDADSAERRVALLEAGADLCLSSDADRAELRASLAALVKRRTPDSRESRGRESGVAGNGDRWYALRGEVEDFPLSWLLQVLKYDDRTAAISLRSEADEGIVYLERGEPLHAVTRDSDGETALRQMLRWDDGSFVVRPEAETPERTIDSGLMRLLLDEAIEMDHEGIFGAVKSD